MSERPTPLVVLQSVPRPRPTTNPYLVMLIDSLREAGAEVTTFSWRAALLGRYDVFHVHWPENLLRGDSPLRTVARQLATLALLVRLRLTRRPIVRTLHNVQRHETNDRGEGWLLRLFDRWTSYGIAINAHTNPPAGLPTAVILHGHYRDWFARFPQSAPVPGRLAYFGLIRPYKGVEDLIAAFRGLPGEQLSLTVSGKPRTPELAEELRAGGAGDDRITLELEYVTDERLAARVSEAELVVLPYREMHNSGAALAALSMSRPVLLPANAVNAELGDEMGPGWVLTYSGDPTTEVLQQGLAELAATERSPRPDLSRREWSETGRLHLAAYAEARRVVDR